ncbi:MULTISPECIES: response regulator transcription factor [unclassified Bradyrhizobium]|uniref:response regulator transcription factor n=1 Tax=unclassified Bradyrhizobium TaxID=2631580 RepID=UPI0029165BB4|nr:MULTISPECIES: response regulator transcription factor [unclassified Bradyrhizobium]
MASDHARRAQLAIDGGRETYTTAPDTRADCYTTEAPSPDSSASCTECNLRTAAKRIIMPSCQSATRSGASNPPAAPPFIDNESELHTDLPGKRTTTVSIFEPNEVTRRGLQSVISSVTDFQILPHSENISTAISQVAQLQPDVVVTELIGLAIPGSEWIRRLRSSSAQTRFVVFTSSDDEVHVMSALAEGVNAYILKRSETRLLIRAIRAAIDDDLVVDSAVKETMLRHLSVASPPSMEKALKDLTWRELNILGFIAEGCSDREIALQLRLSVKTVRNYVSRLLAKLDMHTRTQAAVYATRNGLAPRTLDSKPRITPLTTCSSAVAPANRRGQKSGRK